LKAESFGNGCVFHDGEIPSAKAWARNDATSRIAPETRVVGRAEECFRIEPPRGFAEDERAVEGWIDERANGIAGVAVVGWVVAELRGQWEPGLNGDDAGERPAARELACKAGEITGETLAMPKWECVECVQ